MLNFISVPDVLTRCTRFVEDHGTVDGIYRISGIASNIKKLRNLFETKTVPHALHKEDWIIQDIHCVPSLIKLFFRELPEPLCPEKMYQLLRKGENVFNLSRGVLPRNLRGGPYAVVAHGSPTPLYNLD